MPETNMLETMFGMPDEEFLDKELAKYRRENSTSEGKSNVALCKLQSGMTTLRVMPPIPGAPAWHKDLFQHWVDTPLWKGALTCPDVPRSGIKTCPICAKHRELVERKDTASVELAQKIRRQMKVMMNVMFFGSQPPGADYEQGKVYLLMAPKSVVTELLSYDHDEQSDFPDITGIKSAMEGKGLRGLMFKIIKSGKGVTGTSYQVQPTAKRVDLVEQLASLNPPKTLDDIQLYDIFSLYPARPLEDLQKIADQIEVVAGPEVDTSVLDNLRVATPDNEVPPMVGAFIDQIKPPVL